MDINTMHPSGIQLYICLNRIFASHMILYRYSLHALNLTPTESDTNNEIAEKERMWVKRGRNSAVVVTATWLTWVIFVQLIFPDMLPSSWYVRDANSYAATGW